MRSLGGGHISRPRPLFPWDANVRIHPDDVDSAALSRLLDAWLRSDYSRLKAEWAYRDVPRLMLVEELLDVEGEPPADYKFWCFGGRVKFIQIDEARFSEHTRSIHLPDGEPMDASIRYPRPADVPDLPVNLPEMRTVAERLAEGLDFVRVDLYAVGNRIIVGEMTNDPEGGMARMQPVDLFTRFAADWRPGRRGR